MNIGWTSPTFMGSTLKIAVAPGSNDATFNNDKGVSGAANASLNGGYDILLDMNPSFGTDALAGLNVFVGGSRTDQNLEQGLSAKTTDDKQEGIAGATFAYGPVTVGYQRSIEMTGLEASGTVGYYQNDMFGISFNINDDLSISYGEMDSTKHTTNASAANKTTMTAESIQLAYSMGGMSIKIAETDVDDAVYAVDGSTGSDFEATTVALSLAF